MASFEELRGVRLEKLKALKEAGINPYPIKTARDFSLRETIDNFSELLEKRAVAVVGRVMSLRPQGGLIFFNLDDGTGRLQGLLKRDELKETDFDLFEKTVDVGDFVSIKGDLFLTKHSEKTVKVLAWQMLAKSLRPLPEKWHGLQDVEERFRHRYLDILMNEEVRNRFRARSKIVAELRSILDTAGFLEVETSMLQPLAGGANAEPFRTHHNALDMDLYLRIAPELDLKKLLIAGFPKVYEIGRNFRNEGIDQTHNPEFTTVEWYEAYSDAEKQMVFVESVIRDIVKVVLWKTSFVFGGNEINLGKEFARVRYFDLLKQYGGVENPEMADVTELERRALALGAKPEEGKTREKLLDVVYKRAVRPKLIQPTFISEYPKNYIPLAKKKDGSDENVDAFQLVIGGYELVKAFSELNDPIDQCERFDAQEKQKMAGDAEAQPSDESFLEALEYGMPPSAGVGLSIDRISMLLTDAKNIKEVIFFPTLRPR